MADGRLSTSSFSPQDEREELMVVFADIAYEHGYAQTRLADVAERAGVPLATVARHWPGEVDCLLDTVAIWTQRLFHRMADAFMGAGDDAPDALHRALATMLREFADAPEMVHLAIVELPSLGPLLHAHRDRALDLFSTFLDVGLAAMPDPPANADAITLCITGGLWETVRRYALQRRLHELPDALPGMSYFCLSTFFGVDEALRVSSSPTQ